MTLAVHAAPRGGRPRSRLYLLAQRIAKRFSPQVAKAFLSAVERLQSQIDPGKLEDAIASGDLGQILASISSAGELRTILEGRRNLETALRETAVATGRAGADVLSDATGLKARFNHLDPNVTIYARTQAANLIVQVSDDVKEAVRIIVATGNELGLTVKQQAVAIKEVVGLRPDHASAPANMAQELREGRFNYGRRMFQRDKNEIRRRIGNGTVDEAFVTKMVERYSDSLRMYRALSISRTETLAAANQGQRVSWSQAQRDGVLPKTARRVVIVTPDDRLRPEHAAVPGMNPDGVEIDRPFNTPWGLLMGPPWETNCRCSEGLIFSDVPRSWRPAPPPSPPPPPAQPAFPAARTMKEAQEWARENIAGGVDYRGLDVATANRINRTLAENLRIWRTNGKLGFVETGLRGRTVALSHPQSMGIELNAARMMAMDGSNAGWAARYTKAKPGKPRKWLAVDTVEGLVDHEFGHILEFLSHGGIPNKVLSRYYDVPGPERAAFMERSFSEYGNTNPSERFAELYSLFRNRPHELPPTVRAAFEELIPK